MADHNKKYKELDLQKMRVEFLGFAFTGVPIDTDHAEYIVDKAGAGDDDESTTKSESTSRFTAFSQPETPLQSNGSQPNQSNPEIEVKLGDEKPLVVRPSDPTMLEILVHCAARNCYENLPVKLDTGCEEDWISRTLCDRLNLEAREVSPEEYVMFNGKSFKSSWVTDLCWFAPNGRRSQFTTFRIVENANFDVLLGKQTLLGMKIISVTNNNNLGVLSKTKDIPIDKHWAKSERKAFTAPHIHTTDKPKSSASTSTSSRRGRKWI